jgi:hypothetical protein
VTDSTNLATNLAPGTYSPVVARINADTNVYQFLMVYAASSYSDIEQVIGLAVQSDDESKMAVAAMKRASISSWVGY